MGLKDIVDKDYKQALLDRDRLTAESKSPNVDFLFSSINYTIESWYLSEAQS